MKNILLLLIMIGHVQLLNGQSNNSPCYNDEYKMFDFWLGEWSIQAKSRPPGSDEWVINESWIMTRVYHDLDKCLIIEESIDRVDGDSIIIGKSFTSFNQHLGKYQQLWIDIKGNLWEYIGKEEAGNMVMHLETKTTNGEALTPFKESTQLRMVFQNITVNQFTWTYEYSTDKGKSWTATNEALYQRIR